ncbi:hypothetical protein BXY82_2281 [Gelidibacter sediminis]|uniref:DUF4179 domain-containing protein n=2 Tax=Gelidibacter sediminis TaxID=1608710 RepID=A0A4R7PYZ1_9FLAO|nr:hypothetical protein BXY82_2281 [Gelidibacter sediminis]
MNVMKKNTIDHLFKIVHDDFDLEVPVDGHEQRFLERLHKKQRSKKPAWTTMKKLIAAIAAILIVAIGLFTVVKPQPQSNDLANVSEQLSQTQNFFTTVISSELSKLKSIRTAENDALVADALKQLEYLENNYERLKIDLKISGHDKRVVYAMISNLQSRIDLLENVLRAIENLKYIQSEHSLTL